MDVVSRYDWDAGNLAKCQKHGVGIAEIEQVLDGDPFLHPDYEHSQHEDRNIAVGANRAGRPIFVIFALRMSEGRELVRPLSTRYMHRQEIEKYEKLRRQEGTGSKD